MMSDPNHSFEAAVLRLLALPVLGSGSAPCATLGGHLWQPLPGIMRGGLLRETVRYTRCLRCGRSERRPVTHFGALG